MPINFYPRLSLTGGVAGSLDNLDGTPLQDLDIALVGQSPDAKLYLLDDDSGAAESSPDIIAPDTNAGTKRWILLNAHASELNIAGDIKTVEAVTGGLEITDGTDIGKLIMSGNDLWLKNTDHGGRVLLTGETVAGAEKTVFYGDPDSYSQMYYAGSVRNVTQTDGIRITDGTRSFDIKLAAGDMTLKSWTDAGTLTLKGENTASAETTLAQFDPDGASILYNAGLKAFGTISNGVQIFNPADATDYLHIKVADNISLINDTQGGFIIMDGEATGGGDKRLFDADPDGELRLFYAGVEKFATTATGVEFSDGTYTAEVQIVAAGVLYILNETAAKNAYISIKDNAGVSHDCFSAVSGTAPSAIMLYDNAHRIQTTAEGMSLTDSTSIALFGYSSGNLSLKNTQHGGHIYIKTEDAGGVEHTHFYAEAGARTILYYDNITAVETMAGGLNITNGGSAGADFVLSADDLLIRNNDPDGTIIIQSTRSAGGTSYNMILDPDAYVRLYHNNTEVFETMADGFHIMNAKHTFRNTGGVTYLSNITNSETITLRGKDSGSADSVMATFDPDTGVDLYFDGVLSLKVLADGFYIYDGDASDYASFQHDGSNAQWQNWTHGGQVQIYGQNAAGALKSLVMADPDNWVKLYYAGSEKLATSTTGVTVTGVAVADGFTVGGTVITDGVITDDGVLTIVPTTSLDVKGAGNLYVGENAVQEGQVRLYGGATSGGGILFYLSNADDGVNNHWAIDTSTTPNLNIGHTNDLDMLVFLENSTIKSTVAFDVDAALTATTVDADTDFTVGGTVITDGFITDDGTFILNAATAVQVNAGVFQVGINDTQKGAISVFGHATGTVAGGLINLYTSADHDTTITAYGIQVSSDDLFIGPSTDTDALTYDGTLGRWQFRSSVTMFGENDSVAAIIQMAAGATTAGPQIQMIVPPNYDTTIAQYQIDSNEDDLQIGTDVDPDMLQFLAGTSINSTVPFTAAALDTTAGNEWTKQQNFNEAAITSTSNATAWDMDTAQCALHTLTENTTISAPSNLNAGATYNLRVVQAAGVYTLAWNAAFKWGAASTPAAPAANGDVVVFSFYSDGTNLYGAEVNRTEA